MRKQDFLRELSRRMERLGWPAKHVARIARETSDHWDDLEAEARESGLDPVAASQSATERIGEPGLLIRLHQETMRKANWSGRHPVVSFAVLPPLMLGTWFLAWATMAISAADVYANLFTLSAPVWSSYAVVLIWAHVVHYSGVVAIPAIAWWWARRSFCGRKWGWIACSVCALHGLLNHVTIRPHSLHWSYGFATPDLLTALAPLIVGAVAHWHGRLRSGQVAMALLCAALATGCASSKQPQERGWIGGEYKKAGADSKGVLITRLSTNTPAARSGLREGDLILRVDGKRVENLHAFRKSVDAAGPGSHVFMDIVRDGANSEHDIVVGRERFKPDRSITVGVLLSREWDLWPNPGFSLVALGYKRQDSRIELDSPESRFDLANRKAPDDDTSQGPHSHEGWEVWLPVCSFSSRKRILAQTIAE